MVGFLVQCCQLYVVKTYHHSSLFPVVDVNTVVTDWLQACKTQRRSLMCIISISKSNSSHLELKRYDIIYICKAFWNECIPQMLENNWLYGQEWYNAECNSVDIDIQIWFTTYPGLIYSHTQKNAVNTYLTFLHWICKLQTEDNRFI